MNKIIILLLANIIVAGITIIKTRQSSLNSDTKILLYIIAVFAPAIGLILFLVFNKRSKQTAH